MRIAEIKNLETIKLVVEKTSDVKNKSGTATIHVSTSINAIDIIKFLVIKKA